MMTEARMKRIKERFFSYVRKTSTCWVWIGGRCTQGKWGHGQFRVPLSTKRVQAHRLSYELAGKIIPDGYHLHHKCENPLCVCPSHLKPMLPADHTRHHVSGPRTPSRAASRTKAHEAIMRFRAAARAAYGKWKASEMKKIAKLSVRITPEVREKLTARARARGNNSIGHEAHLILEKALGIKRAKLSTK